MNDDDIKYNEKVIKKLNIKEISEMLSDDSLIDKLNYHLLPYWFWRKIGLKCDDFGDFGENNSEIIWIFKKNIEDELEKIKIERGSEELRELCIKILELIKESGLKKVTNSNIEYFLFKLNTLIVKDDINLLRCLINDELTSSKISEDKKAIIKRENIPLNLRAKVLSSFGFKCSVCGVKSDEKSMHIHHKNGDPTDNDIDNLAVLCGEHHKEAHGKYSWSD